MPDWVQMYYPPDTESPNDPYVEREAYRYHWYPIGWRSDDDPTWTGPPGPPPGSPGPYVELTGAQTVAGVKTFSSSPIVPNPAPPATPGAAASIGEVEDLIAAAPAGFFRAMGAKPTITSLLTSSTTEQSMLSAPLSMPKLSEDAVVKVVAFGILGNNSGSAATFTFRLKDTTDTVTYTTATLTALPSDTSTARPWRWEIDIEGNTFFTLGAMNISHLLLAPGTTDTLKQAMSQNAGTAPGASDPQNWDMTIQSSVSHANISAAMYGVHIAYALPGV